MRRSFDVILYGATGFVGRQTAHYFAQHAPGVRWAIAGRSAPRLEALRADLGAASPAVIVAEAATLLRSMRWRHRPASCSAPPVRLHATAASWSPPACARPRHYVDITGETPWVRRMIDRHHGAAAANGTRIVPGCGFDSVPSDLGAWLVAHALLQRHGERCVRVKACFSVRGGLNGGTVASLINALDQGDAALLDDPFLLNPPGTAPRRRHGSPRPGGCIARRRLRWLAGPVRDGTDQHPRGAPQRCAGADDGPYAPDFRYQNTCASAVALPVQWRPPR